MGVGNLRKRIAVSIESAASLPGSKRAGAPSLSRLADEAIRGGADGILAHISHEQSPITESDLTTMRDMCRHRNRPFLLRTSAANGMVGLAIRIRPEIVYLGNEGADWEETGLGLPLRHNGVHVRRVADALQNAKIRPVITIEPKLEAIETAIRHGFDVIELDTTGVSSLIAGQDLKRLEAEMGHLSKMVRYASRHGLEVQLGGGLEFESLAILGRLDYVRQFNVGRSIVSMALVSGLAATVSDARAALNGAGREGDSLENRRRRLLHRSKYRGFKEMDIIMSSFFTQSVAALDDPALLVAERLLDLPDQFLYDAIRSDAEPALAIRTSVLTQMRHHYRTASLSDVA